MNLKYTFEFTRIIVGNNLYLKLALLLYAMIPFVSETPYCLLFMVCFPHVWKFTLCDMLVVGIKNKCLINSVTQLHQGVQEVLKSDRTKKWRNFFKFYLRKFLTDFNVRWLKLYVGQLTFTCQCVIKLPYLKKFENIQKMKFRSYFWSSI